MLPRRSSVIVIIIVAIGLALASAGCKRTPKGEEGNLAYVKKDDPGMNAAIAEAKRTTADFLSALKSPKPTYRDFSVKKPYKTDDNGGNEHLWISEIHAVDDDLEGLVANEPILTSEVKLGQRVRVKVSELTDWKYVDGKKLVGGYTIRYQFSQLSPAERKKLEGQIDFTLD